MIESLRLIGFYRAEPSVCLSDFVIKLIPIKCLIILFKSCLVVGRETQETDSYNLTYELHIILNVMHVGVADAVWNDFFMYILLVVCGLVGLE